MTPSRLADQQDGVVATTQLVELGMSRSGIRARTKSGLFIPVFPGVLAVGRGRLDRQGWLRAALLSCGPDSFLSHRAAAAVWGLRPVNTRRIEVTVPGQRAPRRAGLIVHRTRDQLTRHDLRTRTGLRVSSVDRLLVELAPTETERELNRLITQGVRKRVIDLAAVETQIASHARRPGIANLAAAFAGYRPRHRSASALEDVLADLLAQQLAPAHVPEPLRNVTIDGWELDFYWPRYRLAVELDSRDYHSAVRDVEKDKFKDTKLARLGIVVIRITAFRLEHEPQAVLDDICALIALRAAP